MRFLRNGASFARLHKPQTDIYQIYGIPKYEIISSHSDKKNEHYKRKKKMNKTL
jgi:hypothetical protein